MWEGNKKTWKSDKFLFYMCLAANKLKREPDGYFKSQRWETPTDNAHSFTLYLNYTSRKVIMLINSLMYEGKHPDFWIWTYISHINLSLRKVEPLYWHIEIYFLLSLFCYVNNCTFICHSKTSGSSLHNFAKFPCLLRSSLQY